MTSTLEESSKNLFKQPVKVEETLNSDIKDLFLQIKLELDQSHDIREAINKLSRDINFASKKIIFRLHQALDIDIFATNSFWDEIHEKMFKIKIIVQKMYKIATPPNDAWFEDKMFGMEEYCEATLFYHWIKFGSLCSRDDLKAFTVDLGPEYKEPIVPVDISVARYLAGVGDLTGEVMRIGVNLASNGDFSKTKQILVFIQTLYYKFKMADRNLCLGKWDTKNINNKTSQMEKNLGKLEKMMYKNVLRTMEFPDGEDSLETT